MNTANRSTLNTYESTQNLKPSSNLYFLQSLGKDWETWGMAKGKLIRTQPTAELMAEIRALAMRGNTASQAETATLEQSQEGKALVSRFDGGSQSRDGNRQSRDGNHKWKRNRDGNKGGGKNHGKLTTALVKGSMTLTDTAGNRLTLHDVCYVPESQDRILSMPSIKPPLTLLDSKHLR
jgi:hypothetical protein